MYFTRSNYINKKTKKDKKGVVRLKIYKAQKIHGEWTNIEELPFNDDSFETAHPTLTPNEDRLYFASDRPGGYGMSDIYYTEINEDGSFGKVTNAGDQINTAGRESFPFIGFGNSLYFASDGHPGLGGLDIFISKPAQLSFSEVANLGMPVNSSADDFSFTINEKLKAGYFASNRDGGKGSDDLYVFQIDETFKIQCKKLITGNVTDIETNQFLTDAKVVLLADSNGMTQEIMTNSNGEFSFLSDCEDDKKSLVGTKTGYLKATENVPYTGNISDTIIVNLQLIKELNTPSGGYDLAKLIRMDPIYFSFDRYNINASSAEKLKKIAAVLSENDGILLDVKSYTDSRGSSAYNDLLSERRANNTVNYLVKQGISAKRMSGKGYGETQLKNPCADGAPCSKKEHQLNRRSEFIIKNEVIYTVQVGAFYGEPDIGILKEANDLYSYEYDDGFIRFYSGIFTTKQEAEARKKQLRIQGFNKPFVRALQNDGDIVSDINV